MQLQLPTLSRCRLRLPPFFSPQVGEGGEGAPVGEDAEGEEGGGEWQVMKFNVRSTTPLRS